MRIPQTVTPSTGCWNGRKEGKCFPQKLSFLLAPNSPRKSKGSTKRMGYVEVALIFMPGSCLYPRKIPLTTLKWKSVIDVYMSGVFTQGGHRTKDEGWVCWRVPLLNYIWQSSRKHMLPDNLPKVLMKDMGLIFPATLSSYLCVCVSEQELMSFLCEYCSVAILSVCLCANIFWWAREKQVSFSENFRLAVRLWECLSSVYAYNFHFINDFSGRIFRLAAGHCNHAISVESLQLFASTFGIQIVRG